MCNLTLTNKLNEKLIDIRKELNKNAELSFNEFKTQKILSRILSEYNIDHKFIGGTGIVATIGDISNDSKVIAVRADMDALPVNGASHLCGHDYHMTVALGTALLLKETNFQHPVKFLFQPGEECGGGAVKLIEEGALKGPDVDTIIGFHVWPNVPVGSIEITAEASMASVDDFFIDFKGVGGHAATPERCINPIYASIDFIEKIEKFKKSLQGKYVLTIGGIGGGERANIISENSRVFGTFRTFDNEIRNKIKNFIETTISEVSKIHNVDGKITYDYPYPPLIPNKIATEKFKNFAIKLLGEDKVSHAIPTYAAEDFSYFCDESLGVKGVHFRLGIEEDTKGTYPLHSPNFSASDKCIKTGVNLLASYLTSFYK
ncbi:amidohydrolase [Clostridium bornimense]|uniref:M20 family metallopeptidase n=1 Tax=Clostridium bornimense TaxID=1216932 RepID=UPI001C119338|nr:M20 family metallopeptidase [Clostridium bornimense]MBU5314858.1 amidohydrolase [Clostridium bornimense]